MYTVVVVSVAICAVYVRTSAQMRIMYVCAGCRMRRIFFSKSERVVCSLYRRHDSGHVYGKFPVFSFVFRLKATNATIITYKPYT